MHPARALYLLSGNGFGSFLHDAGILEELEREHIAVCETRGALTDQETGRFSADAELRSTLGNLRRFSCSGYPFCIRLTLTLPLPLSLSDTLSLSIYFLSLSLFFHASSLSLSEWRPVVSGPARSTRRPKLGPGLHKPQ